MEKGSISINTENIFPIIKKFLYSDNEIFLRELVSNATDATQKLKRLSSLGEFKGELPKPLVEVKLDDKVIRSADLVALNAVEEGGFFRRLWDSIRLFFYGLFN